MWTIFWKAQPNSIMKFLIIKITWRLYKISLLINFKWLCIGLRPPWWHFTLFYYNSYLWAISVKEAFFLKYVSKCVHILVFSLMDIFLQKYPNLCDFRSDLTYIIQYMLIISLFALSINTFDEHTKSSGHRRTYYKNLQFTY